MDTSSEKTLITQGMNYHHGSSIKGSVYSNISEILTLVSFPIFEPNFGLSFHRFSRIHLGWNKLPWRNLILHFNAEEIQVFSQWT